ncbi:SYLF-domain-containing protein [Phanerochaete sordida]|uniref:SYLF-domain-containing protein n=1 Tax=Phanerochaete sordida TaxID=48140 RepID=A0A9P3L8V8_9APHY|nr:SYLF-domain-containing protein [Phanerochaete sordida]
MKFNSPIPSSLPKECQKASKIFQQFVDGGNNGLDGVIPRSVLQNAKGFAIFTVFKAGFLFSARAGSGVVIARLQDGTWSCPSAIGTAGIGVGGQAGAEMTDFLVVLNSQAAVQSFMAAGSLTLGGNLSIAVGPLGRNGEAIGSVSSSGKVAAMYTYSKTRGLFGGVSLEGSVIVERQDANAQAYRTDVSVKQLLSGALEPPEWAKVLIRTLENCTGMPGNRQWVKELNRERNSSYMFDGMESPREGDERGGSQGNSRRPGMGSRNNSTSSYFDFSQNNNPHQEWRAGMDTRFGDSSGSLEGRPRASTYAGRGKDEPTTDYFGTKFDSDYRPDDPPRSTRRRFGSSSAGADYHFTGIGSDSGSHRRSVSAYTPPTSSRFGKSRSNTNPFESVYDRQASTDDLGRPYGDLDEEEDRDVFGAPIPSAARAIRGSTPPPPKLTPKMELQRPLKPHEGIARAIALFDFNAVQSGDLSFKKGQVITVTEMSDNTDTWWSGKVDGRTGSFPANFVEVV